MEAGRAHGRSEPPDRRPPRHAHPHQRARIGPRRRRTRGRHRDGASLTHTQCGSGTHDRRGAGSARFRTVNFFFFHLMPWPYLPPPREFLAEHEAAWVTLPNSLYDPVKGQALYTRYLDELVYAEELGLDGVVVNEHHQNAYGLMPSPNIIAAALTQRTERVRICVLGNALPLYQPPTRVAE